MSKLTGAEIVVECLKEQGVDTVFGYPGGAILPFYDALRDETSIRHILTAHEQGAAHAADGYARASGTVAVCCATSGPGATNLVTGLANAFLDLTAQRCRLPLFHLVLQPGEIAAGEAVCVIASLPQGYGCIKADLSAGTVYYHPFAPIAVIPGQLLRGNSNGAGY